MFINQETLKKLLEENTKTPNDFVYEPSEIVKALFNESNQDEIKFKDRHLDSNLNNVEEAFKIFPNINKYFKKEA